MRLGLGGCNHTELVGRGRGEAVGSCGKLWEAVISHHREETSGWRSGKRSPNTLHKPFQLKHWGPALHAAIRRRVHLSHTSRFPLLETCRMLCLSSASPEKADNDVSVSISTQPCMIGGLPRTMEEEMDLLHLRENLRRNQIDAESSRSMARCSPPRIVQGLFYRWKTQTPAVDSGDTLYICLSAGQETVDRRMSSTKN